MVKLQLPGVPTKLVYRLSCKVTESTLSCVDIGVTPQETTMVHPIELRDQSVSWGLQTTSDVERLLYNV